MRLIKKSKKATLYQKFVLNHQYIFKSLKIKNKIILKYANII